MTQRLTLSRWDEWFDLGSWQDPRLLHADPSDRILLCPSALGDGYYQNIFLEDNITLVILDYRLHDDLVLDVAGECDRIEVVIQLGGSQSGETFCVS